MTVAQLERAAAERGGALCSSSGPAVEQPVAGGHHLQHQGAGGARLLHDVPHVRQVYNWDCGLACVLMLLRGLGVQDIDLRSLCSLCPTTSIWTVDLAYLLRRFGAEVTFCTVTLGANPAFEHELFYMDTMQEDRQRVERLFRDAQQHGIVIQRRSLALDDLRAFLKSGQYLVIVLVDKRKFNHGGPGGDAAAAVQVEAYTGHYVLVCGHDSSGGGDGGAPEGEGDVFLVRDPASSRPLLEIPGEQLEEARRAFGTDEDVLVVRAASLHGNGPDAVPPAAVAASGR